MGALIILLACAWPSSAPSPSQPYTVETVAYDLPQSDTAHAIGADSAPAAGITGPEAAPAGVTSPDAGPGESQAEADPGVGGNHAH